MPNTVELKLKFQLPNEPSVSILYPLRAKGILMPIMILILSVLGGALWYWVRNNPRDATHAAQDAATMIKNAPRKLAFRKRLNAHPVEGIDDPRIAI